MPGQPDSAKVHMEAIRERVVSLQKRKGFDTKAAFARWLKVEPQVLTPWFKKDGAISLDMLLHITAATGTNLWWLLTGQGGPWTPPPDTARPYAAGVIQTAASVMDTLRDAIHYSVGEDQRDGSDAIFREAANRLRELGAEAKATRTGERTAT